MALFEKFKDTVFLKSDSELEKKIKVLKELKEKYPDNAEIAQDLHIAELGLFGENEIMYELKHANIGMYVIHDLNIAIDDMKAQIDFVVVTRGYIYFIECKNLIGNITVNNNGDFIREYTYGGKKIKTGIYSPLRQSDRHRDVFRKIWNKHNGKLWSFFLDNNFDTFYRSLVVLAKKENILNTKYAPKEVKNKVIRSDSLVRYIENDLKKIDKDYIDSNKRTEKLAQWLLSLNVEEEKDYAAEYNLQEDKSKEEKIDNTVATEVEAKASEEKVKLSDDEMRNKLKAFRTETAKNMNIPPYYVFNNDEMEKLLETMPKTLEELRTLNILPAVKINTHGKKIIEILNS